MSYRRLIDIDIRDKVQSMEKQWTLWSEPYLSRHSCSLVSPPTLGWNRTIFLGALGLGCLIEGGPCGYGIEVYLTSDCERSSAL